MHKTALGLSLLGAMAMNAQAELAEHVPGEVIVKLRDGVNKSFLNDKSRYWLRSLHYSISYV